MNNKDPLIEMIRKMLAEMQRHDRDRADCEARIDREIRAMRLRAAAPFHRA